MAYAEVTGYPTKEYKAGSTRRLHKFTIGNGESGVINHPEMEDVDRVRFFRWRKEGDATANITGTSGITVADTSATSTTVTAGASGAGTYILEIEL